MAGSADWSIAIGILTYIVAIIVAVIYYLRYKKISLIFFVASISTYVFAIFYTWNVFFENNKNAVLIMLLISTAIMFYLGKYFSKFKLKKDKPKTSLKEKINKNEK